MENGTVSAEQVELSNWLSTYGLITVQKIVERYGIKIAPDDLIRSLHQHDSLVYRLVQVPLKNVFNGLILQQVKDYEVYAQKLYIDYLLSGQNNKEESLVQADLETTRESLVQLGESFQDEEIQHEKLIADCQAVLIQYSQQINQSVLAVAKQIKAAFQAKGLLIQEERVLVQGIYGMLSDLDVNNPLPEQHDAWRRLDQLLGQSFDLSLRPLIRDAVKSLGQMSADTESELSLLTARSKEVELHLKAYRSEFIALIKRVNELLSLVSDYHPDRQQMTKNQEELQFNSHLGEA